MALINFKEITESDTLKALTEAVNNIGTELSEDGNIFAKVEKLETQSASTPKYYLVQDSGKAKQVSSRSSLSSITQTGFYYVSSNVSFYISELPQELRTDLLLSVYQTEVGVVQFINTISTVESKKYFAYRVNYNGMAGSWRFIDSRINNRSTLVVGGSYKDIITPGNYIVNSLKDLPDSNSDGYLSVITNQSDERSYIYISPDNKMYHSVSNQSKDYEWVKEFETKDIEKYLLTNLDGSFNLLIYSNEGKSFETKVLEYLNSLDKPRTFTFYIQGGVSGNPSSGSCRGLFVIDSINYGNYYMIDNYGNLFTGSLNNGALLKAKPSTSSDVLWTGAKNFTDKGTVETLKFPIADYEYVKIFVTVPSQGPNTSDITNDLQNGAHEFYIKGQSRASVSGLVVSSDTKFDLYRVGIAFGQKSWRITDMAKTNTKNAYITRIVGINY
ncbi:receptor binding protein [Staphylococcus phage Twort]|uniref:Receptor binding protein n=2 Tax=Staphylococcus phage Twort (strain DSM 17442 / HER 48) TaxID=2908167 RepID=A0A6H0X5D4_BPTWO|nr:tail fiber protein [Staphylococcus phage Twort]AAX92313.1 ORF017 [Staphylococcus phage Twort]QIW89126.1 receptor binding protein [Staphylococcus phage Twort]